MNPNKYLSICSSLLLFAASTTACSSSPVNLGAGRDGVEILDTAPEDDDGDDSACVYEDVDYASGETFPSSDGCNTCSCSDGSVACTKKACLTPEPGQCLYEGALYDDGAVIPMTDGCNTCGCKDGDIGGCTQGMCEPGAKGCDIDGKHYKDGEQIPSTDCNSQWCADGSIAGTLIFCPPPGDCTYEGNTFAVGESFTSDDDLTVCTCSEMGLSCETQDMCTASARLCVENGGDPAACEAMFAGCMPTAPTVAECKDQLTACETAPLPMGGMQVNCMAQYNSCVAQVMPGDGGMAPPTVAECKAQETACSTGGGMNCEVAYNICISLVEPDGSCEVNGIVYSNGESLPAVDCNTQTCRDGMVVTTMVECGDTRGSLDWTCEDAYQQCLSQNDETPEACATALTECLQTPN